MSLRILCSGHLVRHPLGGHSWHHLQYLLGFRQLGHEVLFFEDYGWPSSCYDPSRDQMTADPRYGLAYLADLFQPHGLQDSWCYLAEDGTAYGMPREQFAQFCRECDVYFNLSNINWTPELEQCRRRVLVDTDPVFTQIRVHGLGGSFERYHALFTYGERVHQPGCEMPTAGARWLPTRQPVVLEQWPVKPGDLSKPFTSVMNWTPIQDITHEGRTYGQKDREFEPFFSLPQETGEVMELAIGSPPPQVVKRLVEGGWRMSDPVAITRNPWTYQCYIQASCAEFCVAKHGYVSTQCGWFSDRSSAYLASGRPVVVQDTGFSDFLPCGQGLLAYRTPDEAVQSLRRIKDNYPDHSRAARVLVEEHFDARRVLASMLERCM